MALSPDSVNYFFAAGADLVKVAITVDNAASDRDSVKPTVFYRETSGADALKASHSTEIGTTFFRYNISFYLCCF